MTLLFPLSQCLNNHHLQATYLRDRLEKLSPLVSCSPVSTFFSAISLKHNISYSFDWIIILMFCVPNLLFKACTSKQQRKSLYFPTKQFPHLHQSRFTTLKGCLPNIYFYRILTRRIHLNKLKRLFQSRKYKD